MSLTCPNCKTDLPENGELEYRFCPRCGAEIAVSGTEIAENFQTIPPDFYHPATQRQKHSPEPESMKTRPAPPSNQTIEPEIPQNNLSRPQLAPPPRPPPTSFFRTDSHHPSLVSDYLQEEQGQRPHRRLKFIIIVIAVISILTGGILYLLLG